MNNANHLACRSNHLRLMLATLAAVCLCSQTTHADDADEVRIRRKMDGVLLEDIEYRKANIVDVINELRDLSREYDSSNSSAKSPGINFMLDLGDGDDFWGDDPTSGIPPVTLKARYVSLLTVFDMIMKETGLEYHVVGTVVKITRKGNTSKDDFLDNDRGTGHPLLSVSSLKVVKSFDAKKIRNPAKWKWYCYEPGKAVLSDRPVEMMKLGFRREPQDGPIILLCDYPSGTIYWKWGHAPPAKLFAETDTVNLATICFGPDPLVENLWTQHNPDWDHRYKISSRLLSDEVFGGDITRLEKVMEWIQDEWVDQKSPELQELLNDLDEKERRLERIDWRLKEIDRELNQLDKKIEMVRNSESRNKGRIEYTSGGMFSESKRLQKDRSELTSERLKLQQEQMNLFTVKRQTNRKIENLMASYKKSKEKEPLEAAIRNMEFTVSVVMKGEKKR